MWYEYMLPVWLNFIVVDECDKLLQGNVAFLKDLGENKAL
jgi:hypothetical protein